MALERGKECEIRRMRIKEKRGGIAWLLLLLLAFAGGCAAQRETKAEEETVIVTSFYPMYIFAQNVAAGVDGVRVMNMAQQSVGCLHDYQLQTRDMAVLEEADVFVINGGGMEQFMDRVVQQRADLPVVNASEGISMLASGEDAHSHGPDHNHEGEALNAHVWLDPALAAVQIRNIAEGLAGADPDHAQAYLDNGEEYAQRIEAMGEEIARQLSPFAGREIITFHEAFTYFADAFGLVVAGVIENEPGEEPSTRQLAETCDLVLQRGIGTLFVEPQYPQQAAETIARETGAAVYTLDPAVSGDGTMESYETIMRQNAQVLTEALSR